jgi:hypothetical protein
LQVSIPLQGSPSSQLAPPATLPVTHSPLVELHTLVVHGFPVGAQTTGVPAVQPPVALHVSAPLHASLSLHAVPDAAFACWHPVAASHVSTVHGFPSPHDSAVPL